MLLKIYKRLLKQFGPQNWWPANRGFSPPEWEICVGAILTQDTSWNNVEKALTNLEKARILDREKVGRMSQKRLSEIIKPAGYHNQKARKLKELARFNGRVTRDNLLGIWGVGRETADSILLYAHRKPFFVVDAYTRRIFSRLGLIQEDMDYDDVRSIFEKKLPRDVNIYKEYHALIVKHGEEFCKVKPSCPECPLEKMCKFGTG